MTAYLQLAAVAARVVEAVSQNARIRRLCGNLLERQRPGGELNLSSKGLGDADAILLGYDLTQRVGGDAVKKLNQ